MNETQRSISEWADVTFGDVRSNISIAARASQELAELLMMLARDDSDANAIEECADIVIILMRLVERLNGSLADAIQQKMRINRTRTWLLDGNGHGQHVDESRSAEFYNSLEQEP